MLTKPLARTHEQKLACRRPPRNLSSAKPGERRAHRGSGKRWIRAFAGMRRPGEIFESGVPLGARCCSDFPTSCPFNFLDSLVPGPSPEDTLAL